MQFRTTPTDGNNTPKTTGYNNMSQIITSDDIKKSRQQRISAAQTKRTQTIEKNSINAGIQAKYT